MKREINTKSIYKLTGERWKREIQRTKIGKGRKRKTRIAEKYIEREANKKKKSQSEKQEKKSMYLSGKRRETKEEDGKRKIKLDLIAKRSPSKDKKLW